MSKTASRSRGRKKTPAYQYAKDHVTDADMSPFYQRVLQSDGEITAVRVPPNPALRRFDADLNDTQLNKAIRDAANVLKDDATAKNLVDVLAWNMCVLGQVGDLSRGEWVQGVTVAPTLEEALEPAHFRRIPVHLLTPFVPKKVRNSKALGKYLLKSTDNGRTLPGARLCTVGDVTFPWIRYDPRYLVDLWAKNKYKEAVPKGAPAGGGTDDEEVDDVEEEAEAPVAAQPKKRPAKTPSTTTTASSSSSAKTTPTTLALNVDKGIPAAVLALQTDPQTARYVHEVATSELVGMFDEMTRTCYFPRGFKVSIAATAEAFNALGEGRPASAREIITALAVYRQIHEMPLLGGFRWLEETKATLTTATTDNCNEQLRADKGISRADLIHLEAETWFARNAVVSMIKALPGFVRRSRHLIRVLAAAGKIMPIRRLLVPKAVGQRCALTGNRITEPDVLRIMAYVGFPIPGVQEEDAGGFVELYCQPLVGPDDVTAVMEEAEEAPAPLDSVEEKEAEEMPPPPVLTKKKQKSVEKPVLQQKKKKPSAPVEEIEEVEASPPLPVVLSPKKQKKKTQKSAPLPEEEVLPVVPSPKKQKQKRALPEEDDAVVNDRPTKKAKLVDPSALPTTPFWGKLPAEWRLPAEWEGKNLAIDFCAPLLALLSQKNIQEPTCLDEAMTNVLRTEPDNALMTKALTENSKLPREYGHPMWAVTFFVMLAQFVKPLPAADEPDTMAMLTGTVTHGGRPLVDLGISDAAREAHAFKALPAIFTATTKITEDQRTPFYLDANATAAGPFTPPELTTARVLFGELKRI